MSKAQKYVLLPIDEKRFPDASERIAKFAERWGMEIVEIKEPWRTSFYWNVAMKAFLKRPRGYLQTYSVHIALANTPLAAKKAATQWRDWLDQFAQMKPASAAVLFLVQERLPGREKN